MSIIIGADLVPTKSNVVLFEKGDVDTLIGEGLKNIILGADYRIFNLEIPLTDSATPIKKSGPSLMAPASAIAGYTALKIDLLTLANNHILDQGHQGLESSCKILSDNGIKHVGVGATPEAASKPHIFNFAGKSIGVYACAEHEFSIVSKTSAGANPFDPLESPDHVTELKQHCDYVIVLYHGGKENYRYPSPHLQKTCHKLIEKGADLVICQHSHCIGCEEKYQDGTIVYGQGNFIFDYINSEFWQTAILVEIDDLFNINYIPVVKKDNLVRIATDEKKDEILVNFKKRSEEILTEGFIEKSYEKYADSMKASYLFNISGIKRTFLFRVINKITKQKYTQWLLKKRFNNNQALRLINYMECEPHNELILNILKKFIN